MTATRLLSLLVCTTALLAAGCAPSSEPGTAADVADDTSAGTSNGVRITINAQPWPGTEAVAEQVTPLIVNIENNGSRAVDVRYGQLSLTMPDGSRYSALPPFRMANTSRGPRVDVDIAPVDQASFEHAGFELAPYFQAVYPQLETYDGIFIYNPLYYGSMYPYWEDTGLPTPEMLRRALPEGVLRPGGKLQGWVYFEKVADGDEDIALRGEFLSAETGQRVAEIRVPLQMN